jgi:hypothetical protein
MERKSCVRDDPVKNQGVTRLEAAPRTRFGTSLSAGSRGISAQPDRNRVGLMPIRRPHRNDVAVVERATVAAS